MAGRQLWQLHVEKGFDVGFQWRRHLRDVLTTLLLCKLGVVIDVDRAVFVQFRSLVTHDAVSSFDM